MATSFHYRRSRVSSDMYGFPSPVFLLNCVTKTCMCIKSFMDFACFPRKLRKIVFCVALIDFASRFPPRHLEAARLRRLEASRLSDLQILLTKNVFL